MSDRDVVLVRNGQTENRALGQWNEACHLRSMGPIR
jgi:hypothetical protein